MLNDAVCFKNVYIVTGYTDLRFGIDSLAALIKQSQGRNHLFRTRCICSVADERIASKDWFGNLTVICFYTKDWNKETSNGHDLNQKFIISLSNSFTG